MSASASDPQPAADQGRTALAAADHEVSLLRVVLDHVAEGMAVFDGRFRLLAWNRRMIELMGLDGMDVHPGQDLGALLLEMARRGEFGPVDVHAEVERRLTHMRDPRPTLEERTRPGGEAVEVRRSPMPDGGFTLVALDISDRRAAEQALRHNRNLLAMLLDNAEEGVWTIDNELRTTDANPAMCRMLGIEREALLGRSIYEFVDAENEAIFRDQVRRRDLGLPGSYEIALRHRDGHLVHCQNNPMPLFDARGHKVGAIGLFSDITPLKQASAELRRTGEQLAAKTRVLSSTFDNLAQGVLGIAPDGHIEAWNRRAVELLEVPADLLERRPRLREVIAWQLEHGVFGEVSAPERQSWLRAAERYATGADDALWAATHYQRERRDGRVVEVQVHSAPDGAQVRTYSDVTERVLVQRALSASEARFRTMADAAPAFIWEGDATGQPAWFNQRWLQVLGRTLEQAVAEPWSRRLHPEAAARCRQAFEHAVRHQAPFEIELRVATADGRELWLVDHGIPQRDANGRFRGYLAYGWDVTARKAAERSLIAARDEAERANRAKSEFLSRMSHELRTPLNAVLGFAQLIEGDAAARGDTALGDRVQHILRGGRHLLVLINEVLDLARIESGTLPVRLEPVPIEPLVDACRQLLEPLAHARGVRLHLPHGGPAAPAAGTLALADPTRLQQVLLNLLSNAIKYNREGGEVQLACRVDGEVVRVEVSDTGPGLTAPQRERLFQAFERLDADATAVEGAGIGLALSKALVGLMHGRIGVHSEPGVGSTFWIELARAEPAALGVAAVRPAAGPALPARRDGRPWRVLYVEDNAVNQLLLQSMLARLDGVELRMVDLPEAGLRLVQDWTPDLLLLDIQLPGMSGYELLQRLRRLPSLAGRPAVAVTANAMADDVQRAREAGFDHYLTKPLVLDELLGVVRRLLLQSEGS